MLKCKKTQKEIFGFDGEVNVEISFDNINNTNTACHFFKFTNITFCVEEGVINTEKTFTDEVMNTYLSTEKFPNLSVRILSPYIQDLMDEDLMSEKIILKEDNSSFWNDGSEWTHASPNPENENWYDENIIELYKSLSVLNYNLADANDTLSEAINFQESHDITFYEIILKATLGKYRGYMKLDFKEIKNTSDLLKVIESRLYEDQEYEWSEYPPFEAFSFVYNNGIKAIEKESAVSSGYVGAYLNDMKYLLYNKRIDELEELFIKASSELTISDFDEEFREDMEYDDVCIEKGYSTFKELIEKELFNTDELKSVGQKILESLSS